MLTGNNSSYEARMQQIRASVRLNSRVPILVEWTEGGQRHSEMGYTMDVSPKGCLAIVPQGFAVGQKLRLRNKVTGQEADAVLIWRGHEGRTGWELGLELENAPHEFWGVDF
ncbi:MAG: PilZ domain-containing protein [Acidobacteria bacterium]|nr:PilZ domain-containing protein [Acidobacteriota bacterium]MBS1866252.1 PilZ domain-containing protein [Acidobacteriota bacterium]